MNIKKFGVLVMVIGLLAVGVVSVSAQQGNPPAGQPGGGMGFTDGNRPGRGQQGDRRGGLLDDRQLYLVQAVMDATGLNLLDITAQLRDGVTLGEIVTTNGGTVEAVVADAVASATEVLNQAVTDGRLTQEQADERIAQLEETFTNILTGAARDRAVELRIDIGLAQLAAEMTGLNAREIAQQVRDGAALSSILTENNVEVDAFVAEATERAQARIDLQVAEDRITAEEAAELLNQFTEELNSLLAVAAAM